jgi:hypothetical protein
MRRRPSICDACALVQKKSNPDSQSSVDRWIPYCAAFPERVPNEIYLGGFDHRNEFPGDQGIRFQMRDGGERSLAAFEQRIASAQPPQPPEPEPAVPVIAPMPGEPPLVALTETRIVELPAGVELDRFGEPVGNFVYAGRLPYAQRCLPPEWATRPYHLYVLQKPVQALAGITVPWFDMPGGGTAYFLPRAVQDYLADGTLTEIAPTF